MKAKTVNGLMLKSGLIIPKPTQITIRAEKTTHNGQTLTTLSLSDDARGIMLHVNYDDIKDFIRGL